jgi:hypothetical protein
MDGFLRHKAAAYKAVLGRVGHRMQDSMEPGRDGGRVNVLMYAHSEDNKHEDTNQQRMTLEAGKPSIHHIASIIPSNALFN